MKSASEFEKPSRAPEWSPPTFYTVTYECPQSQETFAEVQYVPPQELWPSHVPCHFHPDHEAVAVDASPV